MTEIDTSRLPRSIQRWDALLGIIEAATGAAEIEKTWLELKSHTSLSKPDGKFAIAKAILAMANRDPTRAAEFMDGHGLVLVGAEAGRLIGTEQIEDHVLQDRLAPYLGDPSQAPSFDTKWIVRDGLHILIIIVAAPADGDRIYPLRKGLDTHRSGTIFARPSTKSEPADAAAIDMLAQRLKATVAPFDVTISLAPDSLRYYSYGPALFEAYLTEVSTAYWHQAPHGRRPKPNPDPHRAAAKLSRFDNAVARLGATSSAMADYLALMESVKPTFSALEALKRSMPSAELAEDRDVDSYRADVRGHCAKIRTVVPTIFDEIVALTQAAASITVANNTDRYLEDVEVKIHVAGSVEAASSSEFDLRGLLRHRLPDPTRPGPWGPRPNSAHDLLRPIRPERFISPAAPPPSVPGPNTASFRTTGSVDAVLTLQTLRPSASHTFDSGVGEGTVLMVTDRRLTETEITVEVTAKGIDGICRQTLTHPVSEPVDLTTSLLTAMLQQLPKTIASSLGTDHDSPTSVSEAGDAP